MFDFYRLTQDISKIYERNGFEEYLKSYFSEIENYFNEVSDEEIQKIKFDIEDLLYDLSDKKLIYIQNSQIVNAFLLLLAEKFIQTSMIGAITIIYDYTPAGAMKKRLDASKLYLKVNDISKDYRMKVVNILALLDDSAKEDEYNTKAIKSFLYFIESAFLQFQRVANQSLASELLNEILTHKPKFQFLQDGTLSEFFNTLGNLDIKNGLSLTKALLHKTISQKSVCYLGTNEIKKETGEYANTLYALQNHTFEAIRNISFKYIQSIGDSQELYNRLQRGEAIIDDEKLLYKYLASFGAKHKAKLDSVYELIIDKIKNQKFDIVDWGCGQATATMLLLDYAAKNHIVLDIENVTLIEPSSLALSRGLLHIDVLKQKEYKIKAINSELDCFENSEIIPSNNTTVHLFSNILDVESFSIDYNFLKKVSATITNNAIFVCVSPNRSDKHNNRLNLFFNHFDENFDTELISSRDTNIGNTTRYEKIFEIKSTSSEEIIQQRNEIEGIQKSIHLDILDELSDYKEFVEPILDIQMLKNSINSDPEYVIFKIRKVAEAITSKIYLKHESNAGIISFNDKIRYLSYDKKLFDKTITNYVHTLRTIGNRGVHDNEREASKLKLDAHLMTIALISFLKELVDKKII